MGQNFKLGELNLDAFNVIMHDLELTYQGKHTIDERYHYDLLKGNLEDLFGFYTNIKSNAQIKNISKEEAEIIIEENYPYGKFWFREDKKYIAIDNSTGGAFTEEFLSIYKTLDWLNENFHIEKQFKNSKIVSDKGNNFIVLYANKTKSKEFDDENKALEFAKSLEDEIKGEA